MWAHSFKAALAIAIAACASACAATTEAPSASEEQTASATAADTAGDVCWRRTTTRGVGTVPSVCDGEKSGALCYPACAPGYVGVGPVCWHSCPAGYADDGATCRRDADIINADNSRCPSYDKCGLTLDKGCSTCPPGYANDGCTCRRDPDIFAKASYTRAAESMHCAANQVEDAGLCYDACPAHYDNAGPVCWMVCPSAYPVTCGAGCAKTADACTKSISSEVLSTVKTVMDLVGEKYDQAASDAVSAANSFSLPLCPAPVITIPRIPIVAR
jgi:hypothetical protein